MTDVVLAEMIGEVALITLHRPAKRNAFTAEMGRRLGERFRQCDDNDRVRAIVLTGTPPAFCAGADLTPGTDTFAAPVADFSASPVSPPAFALRKPVIAAVNGHAIGIGLTIALQADLRIMADDARYAIPQVRLGVLPDAMAHWTLPRIAGMANAAELLLTGRTFDGAEALRFGIANRSLPAEEVVPAALHLAAQIAANVAPMSAALSKRLLWDAACHGYTAEQVADLETALHLRVMGSADATEAVRAFRQRRQPEWSARLSTDWQELPRP
ncbi:enoyl-CoA hydratase/isomerase family protein [Mycobacterium talmoniae]|uniref:Carnitinyl-CoA dehydratase n=1 Tax=Mycobacterium talmoniae TaxID=1858794 RepID=A0A1S1NIJ3_9MYCO|nr:MULTISPECIES: enoyl-CoA hydratase-related protein [Mycobacterium]OHV03649.1 crotonase [Mycobacterium talmoniae]PQM49566.1 Carnitinyl-CoA dehydratase [Mycobacterium talmoniae]TDH53136.1 crotonase [Mycobacterium eburneum]